MLDDDDNLSETSGDGGCDENLKSEEMEDTCWLDSLTLAVPEFSRKRKR